MNNTRISFLGPSGTYSEQAAQMWCGDCQLVSVDSIPDVAKAVTDGKSDIGIVPIENSIEGGVTFTLDLLIHDSDFKDTDVIYHKLGDYCYLTLDQFLYAYKHYVSA